MSHWTRTLRFARGHTSRAFTAAHTGTHGACHVDLRLRPDARRDRTTPTRTLRLDPTLAIRGLIATHKHIFYELRLNRESILSRSS